MSRIIIVKLEFDGNGNLIAQNFDGRYKQRIQLTYQIEQLFKHRTSVFAEARVMASGQIVIVGRARARAW